MNFIIKIFAVFLAGKIMKSLLTIIACVALIVGFLVYTGKLDLGKLKDKFFKGDGVSFISSDKLKSVIGLGK